MKWNNIYADQSDINPATHCYSGGLEKHEDVPPIDLLIDSPDSEPPYVQDLPAWFLVWIRTGSFSEHYRNKQTREQETAG